VRAEPKRTVSAEDVAVESCLIFGGNDFKHLLRNTGTKTNTKKAADNKGVSYQLSKEYLTFTRQDCGRESSNRKSIRMSQQGACHAIGSERGAVIGSLCCAYTLCWCCACLSLSSLLHSSHCEGRVGTLCIAQCTSKASVPTHTVWEPRPI